MEQPGVPDEGIDRSEAGYLDLVSKVERNQSITLAINKDILPSYLRAASATGFKVKKIAEEGEWFLSSVGKSKIPVQGKGYIAVSIERPEGSKDHRDFWRSFESLDQNTVPPSSPSPTKS